jgi:hypothetical protein
MNAKRIRTHRFCTRRGSRIFAAREKEKAARAALGQKSVMQPRCTICYSRLPLFPQRHGPDRHPHPPTPLAVGTTLESPWP